MGSASSAKRLSRPDRSLCTSPARCRTRRCLVTAWRVRRVPEVSSEMDAGRPAPRRATRARRVLSPSAAKSTAWGVCRLRVRLWLLRNITLDVQHLLCPAAAVAALRIAAPLFGDVFKARLGDCEQRAGSYLLEMKLDEGTRRVGVVGRIALLIVIANLRPCEREKLFRLHFLNQGFPHDVLVAGIEDMAARTLADDERAVKRDEEPLAELAVVG